MKAIGEIVAVRVENTATKYTQNNTPYTSERVVVEFQSGDDIFLIPAWNSVYEGQTHEETMQRRGFTVGAVGTMQLSFGRREWNGRIFQDCTLVRWAPAQTKQQAPAQSVSENIAQSVDQVFAEAAEQVAINPQTGLPF